MKRRSASIHASISSSGVMLFAMCRSYGFRWPDSVGAITLPTMAISDEKYVNLTTFTRGGRPKPTPVWITDTGDGTVGFTTFSTSWKVKRINNDAKGDDPAKRRSGQSDGGNRSSRGHCRCFARSRVRTGEETDSGEVRNPVRDDQPRRQGPRKDGQGLRNRHRHSHHPQRFLTVLWSLAMPSE